MSLKIEISDKCTGHGRCYTLASGVFDADDVGNGVVVRAVVDSAADREAAQRGALGCPEGAIVLTEKD